MLDLLFEPANDKWKEKKKQLFCSLFFPRSLTMCLSIMLVSNWEWIVVTPIKNKGGMYAMWSVFSVFAVHNSLLKLTCGMDTVL